MNFWEAFLPKIFAGWIVTIQLLIVSIPLGVLLAIALAVARVYGKKPISLITGGFITLVRAIPLLITLLIIFFVLPSFDILFSPFVSAVLGFIICSGAYQAEHIRGAIRSIDAGQSLAAQALGMSKFREVVHIILPQALRRALPGISNEVIYLILYSSLASFIGVSEIFLVSKSFNNLHFYPNEIFLTDALIYLLMATIARAVFRLIEKTFRTY